MHVRHDVPHSPATAEPCRRSRCLAPGRCGAAPTPAVETIPWFVQERKKERRAETKETSKINRMKERARPRERRQARTATDAGNGISTTRNSKWRAEKTLSIVKGIYRERAGERRTWCVSAQQCSQTHTRTKRNQAAHEIALYIHGMFSTRASLEIGCWWGGGGVLHD